MAQQRKTAAFSTDVPLPAFYKNIVPRWARVLRDAQRPVVLFPYLTSGVAESVLGTSTRIDVYTRFDAELFASGGSSITTVRALVEAGHRLFDLPDLHAKLVLVPGVFASIGSQNLTRRSERNLELSAAFVKPHNVDAIEKIVATWILERQPITLAMIRDMEKRVAQLRDGYATMREKARQANMWVAARKEARQTRRDEKKAAHREMLLDIRRAVTNGTESNKPVRATVSWRGTRKTLMSARYTRLTEWQIQRHTLRLEPTKRYLCVIRDLGKLGWARVCQTRITFVAGGLGTSRSIPIQGKYFKLYFKTDVDVALRTGINLQITVRNEEGDDLCLVHTAFGLHRLQARSITRCTGGGASASEKDEASAYIRAHEKAFSQAVTARMTRPFKYSAKLLGDEADEFFGELGTKFDIRVVLIGEMPILVAEIIEG